MVTPAAAIVQPLALFARPAATRLQTAPVAPVTTVRPNVPAALHWQPPLTVLAATVLAIESLVFIGVHVKYREITPMILSGVLGLLMAFIAYGRMVLKPIS